MKRSYQSHLDSDKTSGKSSLDLSPNLLEVKGLKKYFPITRGWMRRVKGVVKAVDDVSFHVRRREVLGLVGESGCGKTTTGRAILRAIDPTEGQVLFHDEDGTVDIAKLSKAELRPYRPKMQMIFQDPHSSLNPRMTVGDIVGEPLLVNGLAHGRALKEKVAELLDVVGLDPLYMSRYPHAFSGGQRQRIGIARALSLNPKLVVADEPVSALDVSIQAQILNLLIQLQEEFELTFIFISHDLGVIEHICDRVAVMYLGRIVELADTDTLFSTPKHPYVEALLAAVPRIEGDESKSPSIRGEVTDPIDHISGCAFHPRCPYAQEICRHEDPQLEETAHDPHSPHLVACHFARELTLQGVSESPNSEGELTNHEQARPDLTRHD